MKRASVDFDRITGSPKNISAQSQLLTDENGNESGVGRTGNARFPGTDPNRAVKAFIQAHTNLFGFGPEALDKAQISKSYRTAHNGVRTTVWEQQVEGIPVFEGVFIAHTTRRGELINVSSQFVPNPDQAAAFETNSSRPLAPTLHPHQAASAALRSVGEATEPQQLRDLDSDSSKSRETSGAAVKDSAHGAQHHRFRGPGLKGDAEAKLIWLPMSKNRLRLCWDVIFTSQKRGEMFRALVDARSGQILLRRNLTSYISDATYRIFTGDSPTPMSPGWTNACTNQPPYVSSQLVTISAFDTNASPNGWIDDGVTETLGNNVDAHTDHDGDDMPDLPRPDGGTNRLFDFTMDLSVDDPTNYANASVVNAFYWCNWMHDRLYQLGFTEAAGNFQGTNFGRGGSEGDPILADVQDGSGYNNANFSVGPDGTPGRVQFFIFTGPSPRRDGGLDAEVVLHECTHGLSNRRVGDGVLISDLQTRGMGEGWSDFYALCLLSDPGDDENGNYAFGAYVSYNLLGNSVANYYYGIRRYPYTTDISKNPLTFKDIDPSQADPHTGVIKNPVIGTAASEVHNQGEIWCSALWQARANLIAKYGALAGNALILQLVTDGMDLSPPNPTFLEARDAILQADVVDTGGAHQRDLWLAFAKRGMGFSASAPDSSTTSGVVEAFDYPDDLLIVPLDGFISQGPVGGPFNSNSVALALSNLGNNSLDWGLSITSTWLNASIVGDTIAGQTNELVTIRIDDSATNLPAGIYTTCIVFTNTSSTNLQGRHFTLKVGQPDPFTEVFAANDDDLAFRRFTFTPDNTTTNAYSVCQEMSHLFPTDPSGGNILTLADDDYAQVTLSGTNTVAIYGTRTNTFFVGSNGYLTMNDGDITYLESLEAHFSLPRISLLFHDLDPEAGGTISWKELPDRVAVTYENVPQYNSPFGNSFQVELFFDGRLRISYLALSSLKNLTGLSAGMGVPPVFVESDFSGYSLCPPSPPSFQTNPSGSYVLLPGTNITLFASAAGGEPLLYQWLKDGTNLVDGGSIYGATNQTLDLTNLTEADSGSYELIVTNDYGSITSSITMIAVTAVDHFVWDHIPSPQVVAVPFVVRIEARDASDILASNFNGTVSLSLTNIGISVSPAVAGAFTNGVWSGSLTIDTATPDLELVADDGLSHTGRTQMTVAPLPELGLQLFTNNYYLVWTAGAPLLKLETTTNLADAVWVEAPGATQSGDQLLLPFFTGDPSRFYRLRYGN